MQGSMIVCLHSPWRLQTLTDRSSPQLTISEVDGIMEREYTKEVWPSKVATQFPKTDQILIVASLEQLTNLRGAVVVGRGLTQRTTSV